MKRTGWHQTTKKNMAGERPWVWGPYTLFQKKASLVERLNRTLKNIMWRYFTENNTHHTQQITDNFNNFVNRSIKMKPNEVEGKSFMIFGTSLDVG